jgi:hypothetical protein
MEDGTGVDLPEDDFDYDRFVEEEFGGGPKKSQIQWVWWTAAVLVFIAFAMMILRGLM